MKISVIKRIQLAVASGMLVLAGVVGLVAAPAFAYGRPADECPDPVVGDDGQPVTFGCVPEITTPDVVAPVVGIYNPDTATAKRNQLVLITAMAFDNVGVKSVEIYVDGVLLSTSNGGQGTATWTPTQRGVYTLGAKAYDAAGNVGTFERLITVR